ncbi:MAG: PepSY domain-containing protein [Anaerolineales bacterium]|nr:PepSY domain-containing protein [Anaerolineales bacterium]
MRKITFIAIGGALAVATAVGTALIASVDPAAAQGGPTDPETPIVGDALDRASRAALALVGAGSVTETEVGDEEGYYEVEVTLEDGRQIDVHLDEHFNVLGQETDAVDGSDDR